MDPNRRLCVVQEHPRPWRRSWHRSSGAGLIDSCMFLEIEGSKVGIQTKQRPFTIIGVEKAKGSVSIDLLVRDRLIRCMFLNLESESRNTDKTTTVRHCRGVEAID